MTREEIRRRLAAPPVTVVVPADSVEVEPTPNDAKLDGAFRSLENQAAYALSQADLAALASLDRRPDAPRSGAGWHSRPRARRPRAGHIPGMWRCAAGGAWGNAVGETSRTQTTSPLRVHPAYVSLRGLSIVTAISLRVCEPPTRARAAGQPEADGPHGTASSNVTESYFRYGQVRR